MPANPLLEHGPPAGQESDRARAIVAAAYELLDEQGLEGLTIRAVLTRSGLARRAFYDSFAGKDDLVLAVFEQTLGAAALYFAEHARAIPDPVEAIRLILSGVVLGGMSPGGPDNEGEKRSAALSREHLRLAESHPAELQRALSPLLDLIAELIRKGIDMGAIRPCDPGLTASLLFNLVATTVHTEVLSGVGRAQNRQQREALADDIWEFCRRALIA